MRRRAILALTLSAVTASAAGSDLTGFWFAEYGDARRRVQELTQRMPDGRWRAEIRIFDDCRETERFMAEGSWSLDGALLAHVMRRRGNWLVSPRRFEFLVVEATEDTMRLRLVDGAALQADRVPRSFRFPSPGCGPSQRG